MERKSTKDKGLFLGDPFPRCRNLSLQSTLPSLILTFFVFILISLIFKLCAYVCLFMCT